MKKKLERQGKDINEWAMKLNSREHMAPADYPEGTVDCFLCHKCGCCHPVHKGCSKGEIVK